MDRKTLTIVYEMAEYGAILIWSFLAIFIFIQFINKRYKANKIPFLYLFNTLSFLIAHGLVLKLALFVAPPKAPTKKESIEILRNMSDDFLIEFILFSFITAFIFSILNFFYLKYYTKSNVWTHILLLFALHLIVLLGASYVSTDLFYIGLLSEINGRFN